MRAACIALLLSLIACGDPAGPETLAVIGEADAESLHARIGAGTAIWGATEADLAGWTIRLEHGPFPCGEVQAGGCTVWDEREVVIDADFAPGGCEYAAVIHEVGHVVLSRTGDGDPHHADPRWRHAAARAVECARTGR